MDSGGVCKCPLLLLTKGERKVPMLVSDQVVLMLVSDQVVLPTIPKGEIVEHV